MTYVDRQLEADLLRAPTSDQALSRVLRAKRDIVAFAKVSHSWTLAEDELYHYYSTLLQDVKEDAKCACCGRENLVNVHHKDGFVVGSECVKTSHHSPCKGVSR